MTKRTNETKKKERFIVVSALIVVMIALIAVLCKSCGGDERPVPNTQTESTEQNQVENSETVDDTENGTEVDNTETVDDTEPPLEIESSEETEEPEDNSESDEETQKEEDSKPDIEGDPEEPLDDVTKVTIKINDKSSFYGDSIKKLDWTIVKGKVQKNAIEKSILLQKETGGNVGEYRIYGKCSNKNYEVTFIDGTYTIKPRKVEVKIDNKESVYGDPMVDLTYTITAGTVVAGDDLGIVLAKAATTSVGKHEIVGYHTNRNYDVKFVNGVYTITQRKITVQIEDKYSYVGDGVAILTYKIVSGKLLHSQVFKLETVADTNKVGDYAITGKTINVNYDITFINGVYRVRNKPTPTTPEKPSKPEEPKDPVMPEDPKDVVSGGETPNQPQETPNTPPNIPDAPSDIVNGGETQSKAPEKVPGFPKEPSLPKGDEDIVSGGETP